MPLISVLCSLPIAVLLLDYLHPVPPGSDLSLGLLCFRQASKPFAVTRADGDEGGALQTRKGDGGDVTRFGYPDGFIYVYDMPQRFTEDVFNRTAKYHDSQYDTDVHLHRFLLTSRVRTLDPEAASLFYIPMYLGYYLNTQWSFDKEDGAPFQEGVARASLWVSDGLDHVRTNWPFWNRTNGADHVAVFGYDNGRCDAYGFVKDARRTVGQLISIQVHGSGGPGLQAVASSLTFSFAGDFAEERTGCMSRLGGRRDQDLGGQVECALKPCGGGCCI